MDSQEPAVVANDTPPPAGNDNPTTAIRDTPAPPKARVIPFERFARVTNRFDVPRLNISDTLERGTFITVLVGVGLAIWIGEYLDLIGPKFALFLATAGIAGYGILCFCGREQRVRLDRAGDNCYYLGLTYTLMSLSVALVRREIGSSPEALIQTFGIAVGSTIVGVIARLLLIQYRMEADDVETRSRIELAAAADHLKKQLIDASARFQTFSVSIQDSVRTAVTKVTDEQIARQKELVEEINAVLAKSIKAITQSTVTIEKSLQQHSTVMENYQSAAEKSANAADTFATKVSALAVPDDIISKSFEALRVSLAEATEQLKAAAGAVTQSSTNLADASVNLSQLAAQTSHASAAMGSSSEAITKLNAALGTMSASVTAETSKLASGNSSLEDEVKRVKQLTLEYAQGLSEVAQFLAKELGRARS